MQNTKLIYKKEFERFFESVNGELNKIINFERKSTVRSSDAMKSVVERSLFADSKIDSKEVIRVSAFYMWKGINVMSKTLESQQKPNNKVSYLIGLNWT